MSAAALKQVNLSGAFASNAVQLVHGTLWSIRYEFDCYLLLACFAAAGLLSARWVAIAAIVLAGMRVAIAQGMFQPRAIQFGIGSFLISGPELWPDLFPFFFVGSVLFLFRDRVAKSTALFICALTTIAASFVWGGVWWALLIGGAYAALFMALSFSAEIRLFGKRVDLSYGVYLYGWPIQQLLLRWSHATLSPMELFILAMPLTLVVAWASWTVVEHPALGLVRHRRPL